MSCQIFFTFSQNQKCCFRPIIFGNWIFSTSLIFQFNSISIRIMYWYVSIYRHVSYIGNNIKKGRYQWFMITWRQWAEIKKLIFTFLFDTITYIFQYNLPNWKISTISQMKFPCKLIAKFEEIYWKLSAPLQLEWKMEIESEMNGIIRRRCPDWTVLITENPSRAD